MTLTSQDKDTIKLIVLEAISESAEIVKRKDYEKDKGMIKLSFVAIGCLSLLELSSNVPNILSLVGF